MALPLSPRNKGITTKPRKNKHHSPNIVGGSGSQKAHLRDQVSSDIERIGTHFLVKLLIFIVHDALFYCNLLTEPNPTTSIRL